MISWEKNNVSAEDFLGYARSHKDLPGTILLYSAGNFCTSQKSFLFLSPKQIIRLQGPFERNPWEVLKNRIVLDDSGLPTWAGFLGYEMGCFSDEEIEHPYRASEIPDAYFQQSETILVYDHNRSSLTCYSDKPFVLNECSNIEHSVQYTFSKTMESADQYIQKVNQAKELIYSGDIYQVNLSQEIVMQGKGDPFTIFCRAMSRNPAPFSAYIKLDDLTIVSTSPERFLCKNRQQLETRPIKGTSPRGKTVEEDQRNRELLLNSPKETAELLMITDLMRNDLGKISQPGTVRTLNLGILEAFTNVFHKHSHIVSEALPLHSVDLVRSCFPGGSITGCPKIRSMQVINNLEKAPRGIYTGSIGYFCGNGDFDFNIAIRTMLFKEDCVSMRLGGGIVADSDPFREYEETLHKGETLLKILS